MTKQQLIDGERFMFNGSIYRYQKRDYEGAIVDHTSSDGIYCDCLTENGFEIFHNLFGTRKIKFSECKLINSKPFAQ